MYFNVPKVDWSSATPKLILLKDRVKITKLVINLEIIYLLKITGQSLKIYPVRTVQTNESNKRRNFKFV